MINPGNSQGEAEKVAEQAQAPLVQNVDETEQAVAEQELSETSETPESPVRRRGKKRVKKLRQVTEEDLMPRPSLWPFALAVSLAVLLLGLATHPILLGLGVIMVIASIIGWGLERR